MIDTLVSLLLGGLITLVVSWIFYVRAARGLEQEAEKLRRLTLKLIDILEGQGIIEIKERDPETREPKRWPVEARRGSSFRVEPPTPRWKRAWRRLFGG